MVARLLNANGEIVCRVRGARYAVCDVGVYR